MVIHASQEILRVQTSYNDLACSTYATIRHGYGGIFQTTNQENVVTQFILECSLLGTPALGH